MYCEQCAGSRLGPDLYLGAVQVWGGRVHAAATGRPTGGGGLVRGLCRTEEIRGALYRFLQVHGVLHRNRLVECHVDVIALALMRLQQHRPRDRGACQHENWVLEHAPQLVPARRRQALVNLPRCGWVWVWRGGGASVHAPVSGRGAGSSGQHHCAGAAVELDLTQPRHKQCDQQ